MNIHPKKILWPTDFSPLSMKGAEYAKAFCVWRGLACNQRGGAAGVGRSVGCADERRGHARFAGGHGGACKGGAEEADRGEISGCGQGYELGGRRQSLV